MMQGPAMDNAGQQQQRQQQQQQQQHDPFMNNDSQSGLDPSESSTLEGSAFSVFSMSTDCQPPGTATATAMSAAAAAVATRDFSRHSGMGLSSTTDGTSSLSDGTPLRVRRALHFTLEGGGGAAASGGDDDMSLSGKHFLEQKQRRQQMGARRRRRRPGGPALPSTTTTTGMTSCEELSEEEEGKYEDEESEDEDENDDQEEHKTDPGDGSCRASIDGSGMTHIAPPSPKPQIKRHYRCLSASMPSLTYDPSDHHPPNDDNPLETKGTASASALQTPIGTTTPLDEAIATNNPLKEGDVDDGDKSIVSVSAKNLLQRKQRREQSFKKRQQPRSSAYKELQEIQSRQDSIPDYVVPPPPRISAMMNNNTSTRRRHSFMEDVSSLANSTIATRSEDDDDSELVLSPITPATAASWNRTHNVSKLVQQQLLQQKPLKSSSPPSHDEVTPNKLPKRKLSMSAGGHSATLKDAFSVVSEEEDDDDESLLSPLRVTLPQEKIQAALKLHMSQPEVLGSPLLALPLTGNDNDDPYKSKDDFKLKLRQRKGANFNTNNTTTTTLSRRSMFQKAKSVSHLNDLEQKLMALPSKGEDDYDFLSWKSPGASPKPSQSTAKQKQQQQNKTPAIVDDFGPMKRRNSTSARQPGNTRSLSPIRNRWITGCRDGLIEEEEELEEVPPLETNDKTQNFHNSTGGGWQLTNSTDSNTLMFNRASPPPTPGHNRRNKVNSPLRNSRNSPLRNSRHSNASSSTATSKPTLAKARSTPNLNVMEESPAVSTEHKVIDPLPAEKIESIVAFLLGQGLVPAPLAPTPSTAPTAATGTTVTAATTATPPSLTTKMDKRRPEAETTEKETLLQKEEPEPEVELHDKEAKEKADLIKNASEEDASTQDTPSSTDNTPMEEQSFRLEDFASTESSAPRPNAATLLQEDPEPNNDQPNKAKQTNLSASSMPSLAGFEHFEEDHDDKEPPSIMKKIKNRVKNVGQAGTRYLRKKKSHSLIISADKLETTRLNKSMTSFDISHNNNNSSSAFLMEKLEELTGEDDATTPAEVQDSKKETTGSSTKASSRQRNPGGSKRDSFKLPKKLRGKRLPFMRSSSVPSLGEEEGAVTTDPGAVIAMDQGAAAPAAEKQSQNYNSGGSRQPKSRPSSPKETSRQSVSPFANTTASPVGTVRRKRLIKPHSSQRNLASSAAHSSPLSDSPTPKRVGTQRRSLMTKGSSVTSVEATDHSTAVSPPSTRMARGGKQRIKRSSTESEKRSRSSTPRGSKKQRSKSASSRPRKEKGRRSSSRSRKKSPGGGSRGSHLHSSMESLQSYFESDSSARHQSEVLAVKLREEVRRSKRENSPKASFRRHGSQRNVDGAPSTRKSSTGQKPRDRRLLMKAQSSRDIYQRRSKSRVVDESSIASARPSKRASKMRLARQAKSERFLGSSASSIEGQDESAASIRQKGKSKRRSTSSSRARTGSYTSLLNAPTTPSTSKKPVSRPQIAEQQETTDSDQGIPNTPASSRRSVTSRSSRAPGGSTGRTKRMGKSQSLRHVPDLLS